jgi:rubrerythrin
MGKRFSRRIENFVCENCGQFVEGNGYTNHCPKCLFSKHVDVFPGDRLATCGGIMEPLSVECERNSYIITFRCEKCGYEKRNKSSENDDFDKIIKFSNVDAQKRR